MQCVLFIKNFVFSLSDSGQSYASFVSLILQPVGFTVTLIQKLFRLGKITLNKNSCSVRNKQTTTLKISENVFRKLILVKCSGLNWKSLSTRSFCESILFVHLKVLRGNELRLVRTVGMVKLVEILFETLSKNGTNTKTTTTSLLQPIVCTNQCYYQMSII